MWVAGSKGLKVGYFVVYQTSASRIEMALVHT